MLWFYVTYSQVLKWHGLPFFLANKKIEVDDGCSLYLTRLIYSPAKNPALEQDRNIYGRLHKRGLNSD